MRAVTAQPPINALLVVPKPGPTENAYLASDLSVGCLSLKPEYPALSLCSRTASSLGLASIPDYVPPPPWFQLVVSVPSS